MTEDDEGGLHAEVSGGVDTAPPVVFLHGFGGSGSVWNRVGAAIGRDHPTIVYDLPGHGRSLAVAGGSGQMAKAILANLSRRGIARCHLAGHSMGGAVAALMALREPQRIASMTLLAPGGFGPEINHRLLERYAEAEDEDAMRLCLEHMFGWNSPVPPAYVAELVALRRRPGAVAALRAILPSMVKSGSDEGGARIQGMLPRDGLAALTMPVKVLWGTQDRVLPTRQAHKLPPLFAAHVFEDTGHMLIEEQEAAVITLVMQNVKTGA